MKRIFTILMLLCNIFLFAQEKGTVYIVAATDCSFNPYGGLYVYDGRLWQSKLYSTPSSSIFTVMDTAYRTNNKDSFGTPMKLTWYVMGGNIFDLSNNCNVPIRSNNALYLMQKYHSDKVEMNDDVLSIHYHNYLWFDSDGDGTSYWNQGMDFNLSEYDYEQTLCKYLVENDVFPVSFRSGWHYMDNAWQAYEERFVPFDYSNAAPFKRGDTKEPSWFVDWSESPLAFVPYHPNAENYQIEGDLKQWRIRSVQFQDQSLTLQYLTTMFQEAANGHDQIICVWGHPAEESSFLNGLAAMFSNLTTLSSQYGVDYKYCRDNEAMRLWMGSEDTIAPEITVEEIIEGAESRFRISSDGPIFQHESPFVVAKTIYEEYERLDCNISGINEWETVKSINTSILAKLAITACDSVGNQSKVHLDYVPDDLFIDVNDPEFNELTGVWSDYLSGQLWNLKARQVSGLGKVEITPDIPQNGMYKIYLHGPGTDSYSIRAVLKNFSTNDSLTQLIKAGSNSWTELGNLSFNRGKGNSITLENLMEDRNLGIDVIRISPLVARKNMIISDDTLDIGDITILDHTHKNITVKNMGYENLNIEISNQGEHLSLPMTMPYIIPPGHSENIWLSFYSDEIGLYEDMITITSDDPQKPEIHIPVYAEFVPYFKLVDNDDTTGYEEFGDDWHTSSALAYGPSTRYAWYHANGQHADFTTTLAFSDTFDIQFIIPETENAVDHAHHILIVDGTPVDTVIVDQNFESGDWRSMGEYVLPADVPITLRIQDNGGNTNTNPSIVLRADAVRFLIKTDSMSSAIDNIPEEFIVGQNYPNPFNPSTTISFDIPLSGDVEIDFFDLNGRQVDRRMKITCRKGWNNFTWSPKHLSSGIYLYRVKYGDHISIKKCSLIK